MKFWVWKNKTQNIGFMVDNVEEHSAMVELQDTPTDSVMDCFIAASLEFIGEFTDFNEARSAMNECVS